MIKLMHNEIIKIVRKKSFIVMIIIMILYGLLTNYVFSSMNDIFSYEMEITEEDFSFYNKNNKDELPYYVSIKADYEYQQLMKKYDKDSWQYGYVKSLEDTIQSYLYNIVSYENNLDKSLEIYEMSKLEYENILKKLDYSDWKNIVKEDIEKYEQVLLETTDKNEREILNIKIDTLKRRLLDDISYKDNSLNNALIIYESSKISLLDYKNMDINKLEKEEKELYYQTRESYLTNEYILNNKLENMDKFGTSNMLLQIFFMEYSFIFLIMIFMIAGSITSQEFSKGTIKLLLLKPYKRIKILLSKYIIVLISVLFSCATMYLIQLILGSIILDVDSLKNPVLIYSNITDTLKAYNIFEYSFLNLLANLPNLIILATLTFAASTIFTNTALSVGVGLGGYMFGNILTSFGPDLNKWWLKYIVCFNWDFSPYIFNQEPIFDGMNFIMSLSICIATLLLILIPTFIIFKRKDITNV